MYFHPKNLVVILLILTQASVAQKLNWTNDGLAFTRIKEGNIVRSDPRSNSETIIVKKEQLTPADSSKGLAVRSFEYSADNSKLMVFTNTAKVWRYHTRGDYWVLNTATNKISRLGKGLPAQSLMFAKFSPDGNLAAYVS
jgi:dipeptidyl-peptidase-4